MQGERVSDLAPNSLFLIIKKAGRKDKWEDCLQQEPQRRQKRKPR